MDLCDKNSILENTEYHRNIEIDDIECNADVNDYDNIAESITEIFENESEEDDTSIKLCIADNDANKKEILKTNDDIGAEFSGSSSDNYNEIS